MFLTSFFSVPLPVNGGTIPVRKIFVGNVDAHYDADSLIAIFDRYGKVYKVNIPWKQYFGLNNRKYVFVTYYRPEAAQR